MGVVDSLGARFDRGLRLGRAVATYLFERRAVSQFFDSDGTLIHYTDVGEGEPVVLVHGFAVNANLNWRLTGIARSLLGELRVLSMDLRGHGRSGRPEDPADYGAHLYQDIVRLLDHLRLPSAHVVGYSLGGFVALKLAVAAPDRVRSLAVLGAGWERSGHSALLDAVPQMIADLEAGRGIGPLSGKLADERTPPSLAHRMWVRLMTRYFNDPHAMIGVVKSLLALEVSEAELRALDVPVCGIVGGDDPLRESAEALVGVAPRHTLTVIEGADHLQAAVRRELHDALLEFLRAQRR